MKPVTRIAALVTASFCCALGARADAPAKPAGQFAWKQVDIGEPEAGGFTWAKNVLHVTGGGVGLIQKGADQCHFVYVARAERDFEVVARLTNFTMYSGATAGIMARADNA